MDWLYQNKDWLFSGLGVFILGLILNKFNKDKYHGVNQKQKSGNNSTNYQAAKSIKVEIKNDKR